MKGGITLAIYIAIGMIPVIIGPAGGQGITLFGKEPLTPPVGVLLPSPPPRAVPAKPPIDRGWAPGVMPDADETVVIKYGRGGRVDEHTLRFAAYRRAKSNVEVRGPCYSACTIVLSYVATENLCIGEGAFMAFHAIRSAERGERMEAATHFYYTNLPEPVRRWIDDKGGHEKLPLNGYWTMHDRELWALGYPKCN